MPEFDLLLKNATAYLPTGVVEGSWVAISKGRIAEIGSSEPVPTATNTIDAQGMQLSSGLVDIHCHGGNGGAILPGDSSGTQDGIRRAVKFQSHTGSTRIFISAVSMSSPDTISAINDVKDLIDSCEGLEGLHLEGPFLNLAKAGAHSSAALRNPEKEEVAQLISVADKLAVRITLAPELDGALEAVSLFTAAGWKVSVGHTQATAEETRSAIRAGATDITHAFNAMNGITGREAGPIGAAISNPEVFVEVIADGEHLSPEVLRLLFAAIPDRLVVVSDSISAAGEEDGFSRLGEVPISIVNGVARTSLGALAGSTKSLSWAIRYLIQTCGVDPAVALLAASQNPSKAISQLHRFGSLTPGSFGDLILWSQDFVPLRVWRSGVEIISA